MAPPNAPTATPLGTTAIVARQSPIGQTPPDLDNDDTLTIPAGYIHRSGILERGWTSALITAHLPHFITLRNVPQGVSNKAYLLEDVERAEKDNAAVRKLVGAKTSKIPRGGPYEQDTTVARSVLIGRGWTDAHIKRLLGDPDMVVEGLRGAAHRFGLDRVEQAEKTDTALQRRLSTVTQARQDDKDDQIRLSTKAGFGVWRRVNDRWLVQGENLTSGQEITVRKKDGSTEAKQVTAVIKRTGPTCLVEVTDRPHPRLIEDDRREEIHVRQPSVPSLRPVPQGQRRALLVQHFSRPMYNVGDIIAFPGTRDLVMITHSENRTITEDDPSTWGSDLLGFEGWRGAEITTRPATEEEIAAYRARQQS